jgi:TolB protein
MGPTIRSKCWVVASSALLVFSANVADAAPSTRVPYPGDEGRIAFAVYVPSLGHEQIFTIEPDGTGRTMLTHSDRADNINPAWSADGSQIVFERDFAHSADIFAINADGTGEHRVTRFRFSDQPFFSPDGSKIVFTHFDRENGSGVWIAAADGTDPRSVVVEPRRRVQLAWAQFSPDGTEITFTRYGPSGRSAIFIVNVDGTGAHRLTDWDLGAAAASYHPDGSLLAFNSYSESSLGKSGNIYTIRPDGTGLTKLTENHDGGASNAFGPSWSPDGTQITFGQVPPDGNGDIYVMNPDGSGLTMVTRGPHNEHNADWGSHS